MASARYLAQNLYDSLAANPQFGGQPFTPTRLGGMKWLNPMFGVSGFKSRDSQWEQGGQTWPGDDPRWLILNKQYGGIMNRGQRQMARGEYSHLNNSAKAERWGRAVFTLAHELGHNFIDPNLAYNENAVDSFAKDHFREYARTLGYKPPQIRKMWRANNKFAGVK